MRTSAPFCPGLTLAAVVALAPLSSSLGSTPAQDATPDFGTGAERKMIHIVPPARGYLEPFSGRVEIQTLIIHPQITAVDFLLDSDLEGRVRKKPFTGHVELARPPRRQTLEVRGYDALGEVLGTDRMILNQPDTPFGVRIRTMRRLQQSEYDAVRIEVDVSVPRSAELEQVAFFRGERLVETVSRFGEDAVPGDPRTIPVDALMEYASRDDFVRVAATLANGRESEDAQLIEGADYQSEIDVELVQLQLLVTDLDGSPVSGLAPEEFEIRENGRRRPAVALHSAHDVPLVLGLAIDTSNSVTPIWQQVRDVSSGFLESALSRGDRAFVVDFAGTVRLACELTEHKRLLLSRVRSLVPRLGTALNDGILFSLLQYRSEPGRRALVVVTDGVNEHSRSERNQSAALAERRGIPIYFIQLDRSTRTTRVRDSAGRTHFRSSTTLAQRRARNRLKRISQRTGGRVFTVELLTGGPPVAERFQKVFDQIQEDLRHQHVLTYYTDHAQDAAIERKVRVTRRGLKLASAVPLEAIE